MKNDASDFPESSIDAASFGAASSASIDRRQFVSGTSAILLAALAQKTADAQQIGDAMKATHDRSVSDPGPENQLLRQSNPNTFIPPSTDHGEVPTFWNSFSTAHRRIQEGGWSRQVTVADFPLSKDIAGVNMRLTAGGIRELHWHDAAEWSIMLSGNARITAIDNDGKSFVRDISQNDLWFFPSGTPHSIQGLGPDGCEFVLVFDDGKFSEGNTTLISDWTRHTPPAVLSKNWGVPESALEPIYKAPPEGRYIFQMPVPPPLQQDMQAAASAGRSPVDFSFSMHTMPPTRKAQYGEVRMLIPAISMSPALSQPPTSSSNLAVCASCTGIRTRTSDDTTSRSKGRMTVFFNGGKARTADFNAGDIGLVPRTFGHYIENLSDTDLIFLEMFKAPRFMDLSLSEWVSNTPPELVIQHLGISEQTLQAIPKTKQVIVPR